MVVPSGPPPGPLEVAVGLLVGHAFPGRLGWQRATRLVLLGFEAARSAGSVGAGGVAAGTGGVGPLSWESAAAVAGVNAATLRSKAGEARRLARVVGPPASLLAATRVLEDGPVCLAGEASTALVSAGCAVGPVHPRAVLACARLFAVPVAARVVALGGVEVVVPDRLADVLRQLVVVARELTGASTAVRLVEVAKRAGVSPAVAGVVLGADPAWVLHEASPLVPRRGDVDVDVAAVVSPPEGGAAGSVGSGGVWVWAARTGHRRGVPGSLALRALAVRPYGVGELHAVAVAAVERMPPSMRHGAVVPPAQVLAAWLVQQDLAALEPGRTDPGKGPGTTVPEGGGGGVVLRCRRTEVSRLDVVLLAAVAAHGGQASTAQLAGALRAAGWAPSSCQSLPRLSPVLVRAGRDIYRAR